jgi:hypothetical protein
MAWLKALPAIITGGVIVALILLALYFRSEAATKTAENARLVSQVDGLLKINADQGAAIARLTNQAVIDEKFTTQFAQTLAAIQMEQAETSASLNELKTNDPDAASFLNQPVPDSLKRLYRNGTASPSAPANRNSGPAR